MGNKEENPNARGIAFLVKANIKDKDMGFQTMTDRVLK